MKIVIHQGNEVPLVLGKPIKKNGDPAEIEEGSLSITLVDEAGNEVPDIATWERDDQAANPDDPYTGKVVWRGPGTAKLRQKGDADLGDGVEEIEFDTEVITLAEEANGFAEPVAGSERPHVEPEGKPGE